MNYDPEFMNQRFTMAIAAVRLNQLVETKARILDAARRPWR